MHELRRSAPCIVIILFLGFSFIPILSSGKTPTLEWLTKKQSGAYAETNNTVISSMNESETLPFLLDYSALSTSNLDNSDLGVFSNSDYGFAHFVSWGNSNLAIAKTNDQKGVPLLRIEGSTYGDHAAGFLLDNINFKGRYILLYTANIVKSQDAQLSFAFTIGDGQNQYQLTYVHGPLNINGWQNKNYYEKIGSYSSKLIDLKKLLSSNANRFTLEKITITVQKGTSLSADFRVDLALRDAGVIKTGKLLSDRYNFHDLGMARLIELSFKTMSDNYDIVSNGWTIIDKKIWKDDAGMTNIALNARQASSKPLSVPLSELDISESILHLGPKDFFLLVVVLTPFLIYPYKVSRS